MPHESIDRGLFLLAVIVLLAGSLRVYHLAHRSLWLDEVADTDVI